MTGCSVCGRPGLPGRGPGSTASRAAAWRGARDADGGGGGVPGRRGDGRARRPGDRRGLHRRRVRRAGVEGVVGVVDQRTQPLAHLVQRHPPLRVLDHQRRDHVDDRARSPRPRHLAVDDLRDRLHRVAVHVVGRAALDRGEERRAEPPEIGGGRDGLARRHFGRDVGGRAEHQAHAGHGGVGGVAGDAEVGELHAPVVGDEDVARLHVAMGDPAPVGGAEAARRGVADDRGLRGGQRAALPDHRGEVAGGHQLQHDDGLPVVDDDVEDRDDVGVRQAAQRAGLAHDAFAQVAGFVVGDARRDLQLLDRHPALEHVVVARPHRAHRAAAELPGQPVAPADAALLVVVGARHATILTSGRSRAWRDPLGGLVGSPYRQRVFPSHDWCDDQTAAAPSGGFLRSPYDRPPVCPVWGVRPQQTGDPSARQRRRGGIRVGTPPSG